ncbi:MAG: ABC transporter ATP-binding protein/permease [Gemmatimonadaceae bacterium]|nr:ABC transporter ATP-binding protein/permease [Gemmatimonadaceae bacterium]
MADRATGRRLLAFLRPHAGLMAGNVAGSVSAAALDAFAFALLIPFLNALFGLPPIPTSDTPASRALSGAIGWLLVPGDKMGSLTTVILVLMGVFVVKNVLTWFAGTLGARLQEYVTRDLRDTVYRHLQRLPLPVFQREKGGQLVARVLVDTDQTKQLVTTLVTQAIQNAALVLSYLVLLLAISWRLTLITLIVVPLLMGLLQPLLRRLRRGYRTLRDDYGEMMAVLQEVVAGIRLVKAFGAEGYEERRFTAASGTYSRGMAKVAKYSFLSQPLTEVLGTFITVAVLYVGARQVLVAQTMQGAELMGFVGIVLRLLQPLKALTQVPSVAQGAFAAADRLYEILDAPTEAALDRGTVVATAPTQGLAFEHVSFAYDGEPVLRDVSFTARRGTITAFVGASGAGKSTLVDLIPRFHEPTAGRITLDGTDTRTLTLPSLRGLIGIVSQDTVLFNDTVRANIAYGVPGRFTDAQVEAAARAANAHDFIMRLPQGYDTVLGERGTRLSGGQRQRLAIARALLVDPPILILDEATSALDSESERVVQEAVERLLAGRTVFVIAHRLSTVVRADQILVLDHGRVLEAGTHEALLARQGTYWRLWGLQAAAKAS